MLLFNCSYIYSKTSPVLYSFNKSPSKIFQSRPVIGDLVIGSVLRTHQRKNPSKQRTNNSLYDNTHGRKSQVQRRKEKTECCLLLPSTLKTVTKFITNSASRIYKRNMMSMVHTAS